MRPHPGFASESNVHHSQVETVSTGAEKAKLAAVAVLVIGSIAAFYLLGQQDMWLRVLVLLAGLAVAVGVFRLRRGQADHRLRPRFGARGEEGGLADPQGGHPDDRYVFAFVLLMAIFLWLTDKSLEWVLYDLILGWKH
jgi:preprotein translocase subunit SecE